jgi:hypothetical protein
MRYGWQVLDLDESTHILPLNDLIGHERTADCVCIPDVVPGPVPVVEHHSLDGREFNVS